VSVALAPSPTLVALDTGLSLLRLMRRQGEIEERQAAQEAIDDLLDRRLELMLRDD
jgi:hypothetical protein